MKLTNEYYSLIKDEDLNKNEPFYRMILTCPTCGALFSMKACGNRSLFEWFGYHPTDGNCQVVTEDFRSINSSAVNKCNCGTRLKRIRTKRELDKAINRFN